MILRPFTRRGRRNDAAGRYAATDLAPAPGAVTPPLAPDPSPAVEQVPHSLVGGVDLTWSVPVHRYGALTVLDQVAGALPAGQRHAVIGPNGAGKTTLLNVLAGVVRPRGTRVCLGARDVSRTGPARRSRAGIGRTFQTPTCLPDLSVRDNMLMADWAHHYPRPWRAGSAARRVADEHIGVHLERLGLDFYCYRLAGELSHGQRRLLDIGMALVSSPKVLLLDEPAAGLTDGDRARLQQVLQDLPAHVSVLLVEHDFDLVAAVADRVSVLHHGRCLAEGTPDEVRADPAVRQVYLGAGTQGPSC